MTLSALNIALQGLAPSPPTMTAVAMAVQGLLASLEGVRQGRGFIANMGTFMGLR